MQSSSLTLSAASAATDAIMALRFRKLSVRSLQERAKVTKVAVPLET